jgi:hypothetical protein
MARACNLGIFDWSFLGHFVYLAAMSLVGIAVASRRFKKLLTP